MQERNMHATPLLLDWPQKAKSCTLQSQSVAFLKCFYSFSVQLRPACVQAICQPEPCHHGTLSTLIKQELGYLHAAC